LTFLFNNNKINYRKGSYAMRKKLLTVAYALLAVAAISAQNEADFTVLLNHAGDGVIITGYRSNTPRVQIPAAIEGLPVTDIRNEAFWNNRTITSVFIPEGVVSVGDRAFFGCTSLATINIPVSVTRIGESAFSGTGLTSVTIPCGTIGNRAFYECRNLRNVTLTERVTEIREESFARCSSLATINIPVSVTQIGARAFSGTGLTSVRIPSSAKNLGISAFQNCTALASVELNEGLAEIGEGTFQGCTALLEISLPDTVERIRERAFAGCTSLRTVTASAQSRLGNPPERIGATFIQQGNATQEMPTDGLTAAHASLPIPSEIKVTNTANNREIIVTITERISSSSARIIDLSPGAALALDLGSGGSVILNHVGIILYRMANDAFQGAPLNLASQALLRNFGYNHQ
jgi:hypothetical protein